ncbi:hypothetical protein [Burkholderia multivorans]|uniref:hypothetical protein n=1 Tax=Burkholderia multivorans TaxID=87883 RepID=UPI000562F252|nr:hypothetical protein [Burkholderia multivorans]MBU9652071.1 hypothetical protein [Burkholderia multivorans]MBU9668758.1 hypothetical protein [Burkholderia multivorans]MCO1460106.1 hypothetical protein [Burkholderia multivorans]MDN7451000.1 hypothetical protein [Burkholderia multivorans]MDN8006649.1 hypothetical protein [Burkholderia multivorans]
MSEQDGEVSVERGATAGGRIRAAIRQSIGDLDERRICIVEQTRTVLDSTPIRDLAPSAN